MSVKTIKPVILHTLLAQRAHLHKQTSEVFKNETKNLSSLHLFDGTTKIFKPFKVEEGQPASIVDVDTPISAVVRDNVKYALTYLKNALDIDLSIERGNQEARADVIVNGNVLLPNVPATYLLSLSKKLVEIRNLCDKIPTLDTKGRFSPNPNGLKGSYISAPHVNIRTKKVEIHDVVVPQSEHHPAQVVKRTEDQNIGINETINYSGRMTPEDKAALMSRVDDLIKAVDVARSEANRTEVEPVNYNDNLISFILNE